MIDEFSLDCTVIGRDLQMSMSRYEKGIHLREGGWHFYYRVHGLGHLAPGSHQRSRYMYNNMDIMT